MARTVTKRWWRWAAGCVLAGSAVGVPYALGEPIRTPLLTQPLSQVREEDTTWTRSPTSYKPAPAPAVLPAAGATPLAPAAAPSKPATPPSTNKDMPALPSLDAPLAGVPAPKPVSSEPIIPKWEAAEAPARPAVPAPSPAASLPPLIPAPATPSAVAPAAPPVKSADSTPVVPSVPADFNLRPTDTGNTLNSGNPVRPVVPPAPSAEAPPTRPNLDVTFPPVKPPESSAVKPLTTPMPPSTPPAATVPAAIPVSETLPPPTEVKPTAPVASKAEPKTLDVPAPPLEDATPVLPVEPPVTVDKTPAAEPVKRTTPKPAEPETAPANTTNTTQPTTAPGEPIMTKTVTKAAAAALLGGAMALTAAQAADAPKPDAEIKELIEKNNKLLTGVQQQLKTLDEIKERLYGKKDAEGVIIPTDDGMIATVRRLNDQVRDLQKSIDAMKTQSQSLRPATDTGSTKIDMVPGKMPPSTSTIAPITPPAAIGQGTLKIVNEYPVEISMQINGKGSYRIAPHTKLEVPVPAGIFDYVLLQTGGAPVKSTIKDKETVTLRIK